VEESYATPNVINGDKVTEIIIDGPTGHVTKVQVVLKNNEILTFEPVLDVWLRGINCFMKQTKFFIAKIKTQL